MKIRRIAETKGNLAARRKAETRGEADCGYALAEYGATESELERFEHAVDQHFSESRKAGRLMTLEQLTARSSTFPGT